MLSQTAQRSGEWAHLGSNQGKVPPSSAFAVKRTRGITTAVSCLTPDPKGLGVTQDSDRRLAGGTPFVVSEREGV